jgi:hypothetical protein
MNSASISIDWQGLAEQRLAKITELQQRLADIWQIARSGMRNCSYEDIEFFGDIMRLSDLSED